jgi:hypothetical protein
MDVSTATEHRHSSEITTNAQKHKQRNLEKPATDAQDKPENTASSSNSTYNSKVAAIVRISEEGREALKVMKYDDVAESDSELAAKLKNMDESFASRIQEFRARKDAQLAEDPWLATPMPSCIEAAAHISIYNALDGKVENFTDVSAQLSNMLFNINSNSDLETRAIDREAAKKLAGHIAENYLTEPKEKQAFLDIINKLAEISELRDKGYEIPSQAFVNTDDKITEWAKASAIMDIKPIKPLPQNEAQIQSLIEYSDESRQRHTHQGKPNRHCNRNFGCN